MRELDMKCTEYIPDVVLACCVLHNICIDYPDGNQDEYIDEGRSFADRNRPDDDVRPQLGPQNGANVRDNLMLNLRRN